MGEEGSGIRGGGHRNIVTVTAQFSIHALVERGEVKGFKKGSLCLCFRSW